LIAEFYPGPPRTGSIRLYRRESGFVEEVLKKLADGFWKEGGLDLISRSD
jgi:hypothetical protein